MTSLLLSNIPPPAKHLLRSHPSQEQRPLVSSISTQNLPDDPYTTPRSSFQHHSVSTGTTDSALILSDSSQTDSDEGERGVIPSSSSSFSAASSSSSSQGSSIQLRSFDDDRVGLVESDESTEIGRSEDPSMKHQPRKRDRLRSKLHGKFHRSHSDRRTRISETDMNEFNEVIVRTFASLHQDIDEIMMGLDQINVDTPEKTDDLSFSEHQRAKVLMFRIAHMLNPPNLLTCETKSCPYPYTEIVESHDRHLFHLLKHSSEETVHVQHPPFQHRKFQYRLQRNLFRVRRDFRRFKRALYGRGPIGSHQELQSMQVLNYRTRLEKSVLQLRQQMAEYNPSCPSDSHTEQCLQQVIEGMKNMNIDVTAKIEDYQAKLRPLEFVDKKHRREELLSSAPYIPPRRRRDSSEQTKLNKKPTISDPRFDPSTFVDLQQESKEFFGSDEPFWNLPDPIPMGVSTPPVVSPGRRRSSQIQLPIKLSLLSRFVISFARAQQQLREQQVTKARPSVDDQFYDCSLPVLTNTSALRVPSLFNHHPKSLPYYSIDNSSGEWERF